MAKALLDIQIRREYSQDRKREEGPRPAKGTTRARRRVQRCLRGRIGRELRVEPYFALRCRHDLRLRTFSPHYSHTTDPSPLSHSALSGGSLFRPGGRYRIRHCPPSHATRQGRRTFRKGRSQEEGRSDCKGKAGLQEQTRRGAS